MTLVGMVLLEAVLALSPVLGVGTGAMSVMPFAAVLAALAVLLGAVADYYRDRWIETLAWALGTLWYLGRLSYTMNAAASLNTADLGVVWVILSAFLVLVLPMGLLLLPLLSAIRGKG